VDLRPEQGSLNVDAEILIEPSSPAEIPATLTFFLNRGLAISALDMDGAAAPWTLDSDLDRTPFSPESRRVTVPVGSPAAAGPRGTAISRLHLQYGGRLVTSAGSPARISRWLTELNLYAGWIPIFAGPQGYPWEMKVSAPIDQVIVTNGSDIGASGLKGLRDRPEDARYAPEQGRSEPRSPQELPSAAASAEGAAPGSATSVTSLSGSSAAGDLTLLASPQFNRVGPLRASSCSAELIAPELAASIRDTLAQEIAWVCDYYASSHSASHPATGSTPVGDSNGPLHAFPLRVVVVPREDEGYARPPLVVVPAGWFTTGAMESPDTPVADSEWRRRLFHEIAHAFAPLADTHSYDDWINEGLAEWMALRAMAERLGEARAARYVRSYILDLADRTIAQPETTDRGVSGSTADTGPAIGVRPLPRGPLPSIASTSRSARDASLLFYRKGALIIRMLAADVGPDRWAEAMASLRVTHPPGGSERLTTAELLSHLERSTGRSFDWVARDWIEGSGLPEIEPRLDVVKLDRSKPPSRAGADPTGRGAVAGSADTRDAGREEIDAGDAPGSGYLVTGEVVDVSGATRSSLPVTVVATGEGKEADFDLRLEGGRANIQKEIDFRPASLALDPNRIVPRIDATVREALRLRRLDDQAAELVHDGLEAERQGNFPSALDVYRRLSKLHPGSPFPHYREGRVLMRLHDTDGALAAHRRASRLAEKEAGRLARLAKESASARNPMAVPPAAWIDPDPDLRSWNWLRIGQIEDVRGKRPAAVRAYQRALECPDLRGAHDQARRYLTAPYAPSGLETTPVE
jgi:hypothetical protein